MKLLCVHCGKPFLIRADQLGREGACPHCHGAILLPRAQEDDTVNQATLNPHAMFDHAVSALSSMIFHMAVFLALVFSQSEGSSTAGPGDEVSIGTLPVELLARSPADTLQLEEVQIVSSPGSLLETEEVASPAAGASELAAAEAELSLASATGAPGGADPAGFNLGSISVGAGGGMAGGGSWDGMLQTLRRHGLDVVIVFDSTGSMTGEINEVKDKIQRIGNTLLSLVPKARIGLCTYRDRDDDYLAKGVPLTGDVQKLQSFLREVSAGGGNDHPEGVLAGLRWVVTNNRFRPSARKVILLFGDAPPHATEQRSCEQIAKTFREQDRGLVSTVTCRLTAPMPEFYAIADAGGGEAFLSSNEKQIMSQLMVLVFGSTHREKVLEAFRMLEN